MEAESRGSASEQESARLFIGWERRTRRWALALSVVTLLVSGFFALGVRLAGGPDAMTLTLALAPAVGVYAWQTRRIRRRRAILREPFPPEWESVLQSRVGFFRALDPAAQGRFRRQLQVFLGEKRITGIRVRVDAATRVLAAASAIIPVFGFPDWEWDQISEVLVYPDRFDREYQFGGAQGQDILGMVGTGGLSRVVILSKPDLISGFQTATDKRNVGVHEFAHLVDRSDGSIDGVPGVGLPRRAVGPWIELMRREMAEIEAGKSDINPYARTSEAEFFAVTAEYFFEQPALLQRKHPELFAALERVFNQDLRTRAAAMARELSGSRPTLGRNSPCPCGSGRKFKKCCLQ